MTKPKPYPALVCLSCGTRYGRRQPILATWHYGKCGICNKWKAVAEPRDFGHLDLRDGDGTAKIPGTEVT